jgi:hypothetical protein
VNEKNQMGESNMTAILGRFYGGDAPTAEFSMDGARCSQVAEEEYKMPANSPEEICRLFQPYMREGDTGSVLSLYDPEAVFLNQSGELKKGGEALRNASMAGWSEGVVRQYGESGLRPHRAQALREQKRIK